MNSLSWLIYAAEAMSRIGAVLVGAAFASFFAALMALVFGNMLRGDAVRESRARYNTDDEKEAAKANVTKWEKISGAPKFLVPAGFALLFVAALIPSRDTFYMIAASEVGEKVVTTPEAKEMLGDLREVIAKQIKKLKDDK